MSTDNIAVQLPEAFIKPAPRTVQVLDVRNGDAERKKTTAAEKGHNRIKGSKYFKESLTWFGFSYSQSMKKPALTKQ